MIIYSFIGFNTVDTVVYVKFACELVIVDLPVFLYMFMLLPLSMWKLPKKTWFQNTLKKTKKTTTVSYHCFKHWLDRWQDVT